MVTRKMYDREPLLASTEKEHNHSIFQSNIAIYVYDFGEIF